MWVVGIDTFDESVAVNLDNVASIEVGKTSVRFYHEFATDVRRTPELMMQLWSAIPGLAVGQQSQPGVPADSVDDGSWDAVAVEDNPFRITGTGLYEMMNGESVHIATFDDSDDDGVPWVSDKGLWYEPNGTLFAMPLSDGRHIVKLIKLDEVQP